MSADKKKTAKKKAAKKTKVAAGNLGRGKAPIKPRRKAVKKKKFV